MRQAIVSGGTGFIGSVLVNQLLDSSVEVLVIGRKPWNEVDPQRLRQRGGLAYAQLDMANIESLPDMARQVGWQTDNTCVFYNFAWGGASRLSDLDVQAQMRNVGWSVNAFAVASGLGCKRFVHVGSMEEAFAHAYLGLDHRVHGYYNRHVVYSLAKAVSKDALKLVSSRFDMELVLTTNSHVMGPNDDKDSFLQVTLEKLIDSKPLIFSTGEQIFDVVSVSDCARAYRLIGEKGNHGQEYWVGSGKPRRLREYVEVMARLYPSDEPLQFGKLPYNDILLSPSTFSIALLQRDTGFEPLMSYEDTVRELHHWLIASRSRGRN